MIRNAFLLTGLFAISIVSQAQDPQQIISRLISTVKSIRTLQLTSDSRERLVNGTYYSEKSTFKINTSPFKVYIYQQSPKKGLQCLYVTGSNSNKVKVKPNSFPWVTVNLEPENSLMLENRHHAIFDAGFSYTINLLDYLLTKYSSQSDNVIQLKGTQKLNGSDCYHLTFVNPNYRLVRYFPQSSETPMSVARKLHINFYSILDNNSSVTGTGPLTPGVPIIVPNDYASKMELYVDKDEYYPVLLQVFDSKGLFEEFSFSNVQLNPTFKDVDFSDKNPGYKF